jgi:hypothetical protein
VTPFAAASDRDQRSVPAAAPPWVAAWLDAALDGPAPVLHAGRDTVHVDVGGRAVGVAAAGAPGLPHALRTRLAVVIPAAPTGSSGGIPTAYVEGGILHLDGRALVTGRLVDVRAPRLDAGWMPKTSPVAAHGTPRSRGAGLVALPERITPETVVRLVGRGDGLTPLGDDVLCGWLAAHRAAGVETPAVDVAVRRALPRTTTLSATLLGCALAGDVADLVADYLRALGTPGASAPRAALAALGHSSGEGLAHGVDLACTDLARRVAA